MSYSPEPPWSLSERDTLLTTIARNLGVDLTPALVRLIAETRVNPRWEDIPLPQGRTLRSCQYAYDEMRNAALHPPIPAPHPMYQQLYPIQQAGTAIPRKRSYEPESAAPGPRALQPRPPRSTDSPIPPVTNGESFIISRQPRTDRSSEPPKKRGRPSKEAVEQRSKEYAAKGETYIPPKRNKPKKPDALAGSPLPPVNVSDTSDVPAPVVETPMRRTFEIKEESSSGKKRRRKREENLGTEQSPPSFLATSEAPVGIPTMAAQSPSDRLLARASEREAAPAPAANVLDQSEQSEQSKEAQAPPSAT